MKYVLGLLGIIVVVIAVFVLLITRNPSTDTGKVIEPIIDVTDYTGSSATASFTIQGEINSEENHRQVRVSINRNVRSIELISGYKHQVVKKETFPNTEAAFNEFMYALHRAGFSDEQQPKYDSEKGVCPFGKRYIYELNHESEQVLRLWGSTCGSADGNFDGKSSIVKKLFEQQIPSYSAFVKGVKL